MADVCARHFENALRLLYHDSAKNTIYNELFSRNETGYVTDRWDSSFIEYYFIHVLNFRTT